MFQDRWSHTRGKIKWEELDFFKFHTMASQVKVVSHWEDLTGTLYMCSAYHVSTFDQMLPTTCTREVKFSLGTRNLHLKAAGS